MPRAKSTRFLPAVLCFLLGWGAPSGSVCAEESQGEPAADQEPLSKAVQARALRTPTERLHPELSLSVHHHARPNWFAIGMGSADRQESLEAEDAKLDTAWKERALRVAGGFEAGLAGLYSVLMLREAQGKSERRFVVPGTATQTTHHDVATRELSLGLARPLGRSWVIGVVHRQRFLNQESDTRATGLVGAKGQDELRVHESSPELLFHEGAHAVALSYSPRHDRTVGALRYQRAARLSVLYRYIDQRDEWEVAYLQDWSAALDPSLKNSAHMILGWGRLYEDFEFGLRLFLNTQSHRRAEDLGTATLATNGIGIHGRVPLPVQALGFEVAAGFALESWGGMGETRGGLRAEQAVQRFRFEVAVAL